MARVAWVLNFAAEEALGRAPAPLAAARAQALACQTGLLREGDVLVTDAVTARDVAGCLGRAWIPDSWARGRLASLGVALEPDLPDELLARALSRRLHHDLGPTLPGERWIADERELIAALGAGTPFGGWVAKRERSCAGRGRRLLSSAPTEEDLRWGRRSLGLGGLLLEPWVTRELDVGQHGFVSPTELLVGVPTVMRNGALGAWEESRVAAEGALRPEEARALGEEVLHAGVALRRLGFQGPFGVDGFRYRDPDGVPRFRARCEVNARYSMGWALGMRGARPDRPT